MKRSSIVVRTTAYGIGFLVLWLGSAHAQDPAKATLPASETDPATPAAGHSVHGEAFNAGPRRKARIMQGMGKVDFAATTKSDDARAFINQGVAQLHSFYYLEAERSFRQAAWYDPNCSTAYWGMAMSNVNNAKRAKGFLKKALEVAAKNPPSRRERLYLSAMEAQYRESGDDKSRRQGHLTGYETIVQEFPGDIDARAWLAMIAWSNAGQDGIGSRQAVESLIEGVLQVEPTHPGAHHYRIHLWDGVKPERALKSAALFAPSAPGIAHAWHMPGHTYTGLKRYGDAAYQQEGSARVDHAAMTSERTMPFEIHNYAHNNQWLVTSLGHVGRMREAIAVARNLVDQPRDPEKNNVQDGGSAQRSGRARWSETLVRYELWDELLASTLAGDLDWSSTPIEQRERFYTLGLAYAAKKDKAKLAEQIDGLKKLAAGAKGGLSNQIAEGLAELEGYAHLLEGRIGPAFERFSKAPGMRSEALARAHIDARNFGFAEVSAKTGADRRINEVPALAAYIEILAKVGKLDQAKREAIKLVEIARNADKDIPIFERLARLGVPVTIASSSSAETDDAGPHRINLEPLGPLAWGPFDAVPFELADTAEKSWSLADHKGKNVIILFYLGRTCAHCMQQLELFGKEIEAFKKLDTTIVAISTDDLATSKSLKQNKEGVLFPMPILPDPELKVFQKYQAYDDFERSPMHSVVLVDAEGKVRYQKTTPDPFLDVDFLKGETARVKRIVASKNKP